MSEKGCPKKMSEKGCESIPYNQTDSDNMCWQFFEIQFLIKEIRML